MNDNNRYYTLKKKEKSLRQIDEKKLFAIIALFVPQKGKKITAGQ